MKTFHFSFSEIDSERSFGQLASSIQASISNNNIIIPANHGKGSICKLKFEEGLYTRAWALTLKNDIVFNKTPDLTGTGKQFHIIYLFNPEVILHNNPLLGKKWKAAGAVNMFFFSNDANVQFEVAANSTLDAVDISVTAQWLSSAFGEAGPLYTSFISQLSNKPSPTVFFEASTAFDYNIMSELHESMRLSTGNPLHQKAVVLSLLSNFFDRVVNRSANEVLRHNVFHYDKMIEVKRIINSHLLNSLPGIDSIAKDVALSTSTLKRHFKLMFQKGIYEYYLEQKMNLAKQILYEKPLSVNEVAAMLGYEKASNFIEIFKKHFGFSPGSIRRRMAG
ncbi:MAG TPA: AraC family transcriptional regulator [Chitinophagaceae bacterium]